jgi:hypothetical protein
MTIPNVRHTTVWIGRFSPDRPGKGKIDAWSRRKLERLADAREYPTEFAPAHHAKPVLESEVRTSRAKYCSCSVDFERVVMARKYSKVASKSIKTVMERRKKGTLKSGKGGKGGTVKSRKQAFAIGLSEARKKGEKVPAKKK